MNKLILASIVILVGIGTFVSFENKLFPHGNKSEATHSSDQGATTSPHQLSTPPDSGKPLQTEPAMPAQYGGVNGQGIHIKVPPVGKGYSAKYDPNGERELKNGDYLGNFTRINLVHSHGQMPMYTCNTMPISPGKILVYIDGNHNISYELGKGDAPNADNFIELQTEGIEEGEVVVRWLRLDTIKPLR